MIARRVISFRTIALTSPTRVLSRLRASLLVAAPQRSSNRNRSTSTSFSAIGGAAVALAVAVAALSTATAVVAAAAEDDTFVESASGFRFARVLADGSVLVSASIRAVTFLKFQAYAVAFYANGLQPLSASLERSALISEVLDGPAELTMELRPCRETVGNHLTSAWLPKLKVRIEAHTKAPPTEKDVQQIAELAAVVDGKKKYAYQSALTFEWSKKAHELRVSHDGKLLGVIKDADRLGRALMSVYFDNPGNIQDDFVAGLKSKTHL